MDEYRGSSSRRALLFALLCSATAAGCTPWVARPVATLASIHGKRQRVQLWVGGHVYLVHGVVVQGDSLRAVPSLRPPSCDSCALRFALREIDSVRVSGTAPELAARDQITALVAGTIVLLALLILMFKAGMKNY
jgi:hypothetical protein